MFAVQSRPPSDPTPASRLGIAAFTILVCATVTAFFLIQHVKVSLPLLAGNPMPFPATINPIGGNTCWATGPHGARVRVSYRSTRFSFYLLNQPDYVAVDVVTGSGSIVRAVARRRYMRTARRYPDGLFSWNGRDTHGNVVPDGRYYFRISLIRQNRTVAVNKAVTIATNEPHPVVISVKPRVLNYGARTHVDIRYGGSQHRSGTIIVYRLEGHGVRRVGTLAARAAREYLAWNGTIRGRRVPAGTYLVGLSVTNKVCTTGTFPVSLRDAKLRDRQAIVTVR